MASVRCVVLKNHKDRSETVRNEYSKIPHFVKMSCSKFQVALGKHHEYAIDRTKAQLTEKGLNPDDFDFLSFDYVEGYFMRDMFEGSNFVKIWRNAELFNIKPLGPFSPWFSDGEEADQFPNESES